MRWKIIKHLPELIIDQTDYPIYQTENVFAALADALIPETADLAEMYGSLFKPGAIHNHIDKYEIWSLDHFLELNFLAGNLPVNLSNITAQMINTAARYLIDQQENREPPDINILKEAGHFAALSFQDRIRALSLLEDMQIPTEELPIPFAGNSDLMLSILGGIITFAVIGYYTEWSGYGSTCLETPNQRIREFFPASWKQAGYPGPSLGYHTFRGYLQ